MNYKPVPVKEAREIASKYKKSIVIINVFDPVYGLLHTTTFGVSKQDKTWAAEGGDIAAKALGGDLKRKVTYEDFREK